MKRLVVLVGALALLAALVPARGEALTLGQRVARLEAKMNCLRRFPIVEFRDYAAYQNQTVDNGVLTWDDSGGSGNPDELQDAGSVFGLDFTFGAPFPPDVWAVAVANTSACKAKFRRLASPFPRPAARATRASQLMRVE